MIVLALGVFGLIVGSFLNVVILRHGVRGIGGRSGCMTCGRRLLWYDMVPVISWLVLRGRCRQCRADISIQYPLVEAATGLLFGSIGFWATSSPAGLTGAGIMLIAVYSLMAALLVCIAAYDLLHTVIPDEWAYFFAALAFISQFLVPSSSGFNVWSLVAGPIAAAPLFALWLFSRGTWMGLGDAKLALGFGWVLGPLLGILAVFGAFIVGAIVSLCILLPLPAIVQWLYTLGITSRGTLSGGFTMKSEIPFGPFLIFSFIFVWFATMYGFDLLRMLGLSFADVFL